MAEARSNIYMKLSTIQTELNVPKNAFNKFGNYNYRNCESILEAIKPFLKKHKVTLLVTDSLELVGDRFYIKATAKLVDAETGETVENSAYAREPLDVKGMSPAQVTGASSSYARKYALGGLLALDDNKDPDTNEYAETQKNAPAEKKAAPKKQEDSFTGMNPPEEVDKDLIPEANKVVTPEQIAKLQAEMERTGVSLKQVLSIAKVDAIEKIQQTTFTAIMVKFSKTRSAQ